MKKIKEIRIKNFKAFPDQQNFVLEGNNLLLFGENGAGKSSLYWALYTFLQSSEKDDAEVNKYFENYDPNDKNTFQSLLNIHTDPHNESFIEIELKDNSIFKLKHSEAKNLRVSDIINANLASDFITYKLLYNFYGSTHKNDLDIWDVFRKDILPFFMYGNKNISSYYSEIYKKLPREPRSNRFYRRDSWQYKGYKRRIQIFNIELDKLLGAINIQTNNVLKEYFNIDNIEIILSYSQKLQWDTNKNRSFTKPKIKYHIKIRKNGTFVEQHRPQSFLNEAILAQLSLAVRLGALFTRLAQSDTKILVLDDLLISLDMDNREKVLDILLQKTTKSGQPNRFDNFQILFFTHDRGLNYFVGEKIKQHGREKEWLLQEIYSGICEEKDNAGNLTSSYAKPILIEGDLDDLEKAKKYLETNKDYSACAVSLRKALETLIIKRIPQELAYTSKGEPKALHMLWGEFISYYAPIAPTPISEEMKSIYQQSRLMIFNPQAHYNYLSLPVYKRELEKAIELVEYVNNNCPIVEPIIILSKGMHLIFKHPSDNFTYEFLLVTDFSKLIERRKEVIHKPKCKVLTWQYNDILYFDTTDNKVMSDATVKEITEKEDTKLSSIIHFLSNRNLGIDKDMIIENTVIKNSIWTLQEILDKARITI